MTEGDATIANSGNSSTTATLHSSNSTIAANFEQDIPELIENQFQFLLTEFKAIPIM